MRLGAFSVSLAVKNLNKSKEFYQNLGFKVFAGDESKKYLILKNEEHVIGIFEGMFDKNILTFNPGWNQNANELEDFEDVRMIQKKLKSKGIELISEVDENGNGPGSCMVFDPDGNPILIDQHI